MPTQKRKRCPNGTRKNRKTGDCEIHSKVHDVQYLTHLFSEEYLDLKREKFIPFEEITKAVSEDMETQYGDKSIGKRGNKQELMPIDSANWYKDSKKLKVNDVLIDETPHSSFFNTTGLSRSEVEAWLVSKKNGKLGLVMFPMDDGRHFDKGFSDGDTINAKGQMIHPKTGNLVKIL